MTLSSLDPSLIRLSEEGYNLILDPPVLTIKDVPYLTNEGSISWGNLYLIVGGDPSNLTNPDHTAYFDAIPYESNGNKFRYINSEGNQPVGGKAVAQCYLSLKKQTQPYQNVYDKAGYYCLKISEPVIANNPDIVFPRGDGNLHLIADRYFHYIDSRIDPELNMSLSKSQEKMKVGIVGLGGTGSYVLDFLSKTRLEMIAIFDGDHFESHNAFRMPSAITKRKIHKQENKATSLARIYGRINKRIKAYPIFIDESNRSLLGDLNFVFVCVDNLHARKTITDYLQKIGTSFIVVGMDLRLSMNGLTGMIKTVYSDGGKQEYPNGEATQLDDAGPEDDYSKPIQIPELNALNAAIAVIEWKKRQGYYFSPNKYKTIRYTLASGTISRSND